MKSNNTGQSSSDHQPSPDQAPPAGGPTGFNLFTLKNSRGTKLIVSNLGAAVVSLYVRNKDGNLTDIVLGYEDPHAYLTDDYYLGTVVGRYANRIAGDTVFIDQHPYTLSTREGGYHLHGGALGFNKKIFHTTPFHTGHTTGMIFSYTSPHLEEGFPGEFRLEVIYTLDEEDAWTIEYHGISDRTTLVNLTQHTYFNLSGDPSTNIDEHELKISSNHYLPVNNLQVPTGELADVRHTPFDFTGFKKIGRDLGQENAQLKLSHGYDHSFVLEEPNLTGKIPPSGPAAPVTATKDPAAPLKHAATARESSSGIIMDVYTTEPAVHFYTGNFLENIPGKHGITYNQRAAFCLETQHFPDAPNHPHFPSTLLKAGEHFSSKTIFKFSVGQ